MKIDWLGIIPRFETTHSCVRLNDTTDLPDQISQLPHDSPSIGRTPFSLRSLPLTCGDL